MPGKNKSIKSARMIVSMQRRNNKTKIVPVLHEGAQPRVKNVVWIFEAVVEVQSTDLSNLFVSQINSIIAL